MSALKGQVVLDTLGQVSVAYVPRAVAKMWNAHKDEHDTAVFCGWYWMRGRGEEGGPFKSRSAALRDAYYIFVARRKAPTIGLTAKNGHAEKPAKQKGKKARTWDKNDIHA